jgi:hypothetical protein
MYEGARKIEEAIMDLDQAIIEAMGGNQELLSITVTKKLYDYLVGSYYNKARVVEIPYGTGTKELTVAMPGGYIKIIRGEDE